MCFHWRERGEKRRNEEKRGGEVVSRRSAYSGQSGRLMLLYIGCRSARTSLTNRLTVSLPDSLPLPSLCFSETLFAQVDSDTVLNEPQSPNPPFLSAPMAVDCVIEAESGGACGELEGEASTRVHSGQDGAGSRGGKC